VLQAALRHALTDSFEIPLDVVTEFNMSFLRGMPASLLQSQPMFLWYDFFSCPQEKENNDSKLAHAIASIPTYISRCRFFFALCPTLEASCGSKGSTLLTPVTWAERGWCRMEASLRELSEHRTWVMIRGPMALQLTSSWIPMSVGQPGAGSFSKEEDRAAMAVVCRETLRRGLLSRLRAGEILKYRLLLNCQHVFLGGFAVEPLRDIVPAFQATHGGPKECVASFLYQNGFSRVQDVDSAGFTPLLYAVLNGDPLVVQGLLELQANPNDVTTRHAWKVEHSAGVPALAIAAFHKHNEVLKTLLEANADPASGRYPAIVLATFRSNAEGIQILCSSGCSPFTRDFFGTTAIHSAATVGSLSAMEVLLSFEGVDLSSVLFYAMWLKGGTAKMVDRLVDAKADVNQQEEPSKTPRLLRWANSFLSLKHRFGKQTIGSQIAYHRWGATPLMAALITGQFEGAAALIAKGARLDLRNSRGFTAADLAAELPVPDFIQEALNGRTAACERVSDLASLTCERF